VDIDVRWRIRHQHRIEGKRWRYRSPIESLSPLADGPVPRLSDTRRGRYELWSRRPPALRVAAAFTELAQAL
jgi:hypothetical protein